MKSILRALPLLAFGTALGGVALWWSHSGPTGARAAEGWLAKVRTEARRAQASGTAEAVVLEGSGTIEGTLVRVSSKLPGKVARVLVRDGDQVQAGQLLVVLQDVDARAQLEQVRSRLSLAEARLREALAGSPPEAVRQAEAEHRRAAAAREGAAGAMRLLQSQLERSTELKQGVDAAESQVAAAEATLRASLARLDRVRAGARPDEVREAEQALAAAEATSRHAGEEEERLTRAFDRGAVARRDRDRARSEREVAVANAARLRARLADLKAGARPEELREAEQQVEAARAAAEGTNSTLENARQLYADRLPLQQRLEAARAELKSAEEGVSAAGARVDLLRAGARPEALSQLRAQIDEARAAVRLVENGRRDLEIRAPAAGVVATRSVEPGEVVLPGARLLEIADADALWVRVYLREKDYGRIRIGQQASVTTDSLPGRAFTGRVRSIAREAEYTPRSAQTRDERVTLMFGIRVEVENAAGALLIGMPVDVRFD